jgi:small subunit ribosomal protein S19e
MGIYDVHATALIDAVAEDLKEQVKQPEWMNFVKTGRHNERAPHRVDWFYVRMASILYRTYREGLVGTNHLRSYYGGRKNRGARPHKHFKAGGKVIRVCLQELEKIGLLKKEKAGRSLSGKGLSFLNQKAKEVKKILDEKAAKEAAAMPKPVVKTEKMSEEKKAEKPVEQKEGAGKPVEKRTEKVEQKPEVKQAEKKEEKPAEKAPVETKAKEAKEIKETQATEEVAEKPKPEEDKK